MSFRWIEEPTYSAVSQDWIGECLIGETVAEIHLIEPPQKCEQLVLKFLTWLNEDWKKTIESVSEKLIDEWYDGNDQLKAIDLASELEFIRVDFLVGGGVECSILGGEEHFDDLSLAAIIALNQSITRVFVH